MSGDHLLVLAFDLARVAHDGQSRRGSGEPYFNHVLRVAKSVEGWKAKTVAFLHDVVEDTDVTLEALRQLRFPEDVIEDVDRLTRRPLWSYDDYIAVLLEGGSDRALDVKLADLADNLRDLPSELSGLERRYRKAQLAIREEQDRRAA